MVLSALPLRSEPHNRFRRYDVRNGLSNSTVKDILQDREGYIWLATRDGLNRFNGTGFRTFCSSSGGDCLNIDAICLHPYENKIWIGSSDGLYLFDCADESCRRVDFGDRELKNVNCLHCDKWGNLWAGCNDGIYKFNINGSGIARYNSSTPPRGEEETLTNVLCIASDGYGNILAGHSGGICKYSGEDDSFGRTYPPSGEGRGAESNSVTAIRRIDADRFLVGTKTGTVAEFSESADKFRDFTPAGLPGDDGVSARVHDFHPAGGGKYYVGTDSGMYFLDLNDGSWSRCDNEIARESIYRFARDSEDGLWIGTYFCGANYRPLLLENIDCFTDDGTRGSLRGTAVSELCADGKGNVWIATENGGLNRFNIRTKTFTDFSALSHNNIHALCLDGGRLWIGTFSKGLDCLDLNTMRISKRSHNPGDSTSLCSDFVYSLLKSSDGGIYVGTLSGLCIMDPRTGRFRRVSELGVCFIGDLGEDSSGNIWAADRNLGLHKLEKESGEWVHYRSDEDDPYSLPDNHLTRICTDGTGRIWLCTEKGGICRYEPGIDGFIRYGAAEGLPPSVYYGLLDDGMGNLWLSSNRGIIKYNPATHESRQYTTEDGLQSNQFNWRSSLKTADGRMYFGGVNGFNSFYPTGLVPNKVKPRVRISSVTARYSGTAGAAPGESGGGGKLDISSGVIRLPHNTISVDIGIDCLSYAAPSRNAIAWKMEGVSSDWVTSGSGTISLSNLRPGKHRFMARGGNNDGLWSDDCATVCLLVAPHPLLSLWAIAFYSLAAAGAIASVFRLRRRRKAERRRQRAAEAKIEFFNQLFNSVKINSEEAAKSASSAPDNDAKWMEKLNGIISDNLSNGEFNVDMLAEQMSVSRSFLQRKMKAILGMTPNDYVKLVRLKAASQLLSSGQYRVNEVCWMSGFNNVSYFTKCFYRQFGILPKDWSAKEQRQKDKTNNTHLIK